VTDAADAHWLWKDQQRRGPFTVQQVYRMAKRGEINNHTPFWSERSQQWLPLLHLLKDMYPDRDQLDQMRNAGIKRVKVIGSGLDDDCDACRKLTGQLYAIDDAPELPPKKVVLARRGVGA
jgi:hypothetical protein